MSAQRMNVLVYTGTGTTVESVKHCMWTLRRLLSPNYAVISISGPAVLNEPWTASCALFVMPGGADLGYCRTLNGDGNRRIKQYVSKGGAYLGLCAGGYYASGRCEFEEGKPSMAVVGDRELAFFPGTCRGLAFPGFVYHTEKGTRAAKIQVNQTALAVGGSEVPERFRVYYNGGGVFVDATKFKDRGVEILAEYTDDVHVDAGDGQAAVVYCKVGNGGALLTSPHPEFAAVNLREGDENPDYPNILTALEEDDKARTDFVKACLLKLGLKVNRDSTTVPSLSRLYLSANQPAVIRAISRSIQKLVTEESGKRLVKAENDTFEIEQDSSLDLADIKQALPDPLAGKPGAETLQQEGAIIPQAHKDAPKNDQQTEKMVDYDQIVKTIVLHASTPPEAKATPHFNHNAFFRNLDHYAANLRNADITFGQVLLYGEVVTSTNTILEKNPTLLEHLPSGLTATATTQVAGRGRGSNVWVSPPGSLMFSTVLRHPISLNNTAPVVFVQYLMALAIVSGIHGYDKGYARLPVRLKWPNDIYALDSTKQSASSPATSDRDIAKATGNAAGKPLTDAERNLFVKIGGILISTSYTPSTDSEAHYTLVCGAGLNLSNAAPTTSLNALAARAGLPPLTPEKLLASILNHFEVLYRSFCVQGFTGEIMRGYEKAWLHSGQIVTVEEEAKDAAVVGGWDGIRGESGREERFVVRGISPDWGLLVVEEVIGEPGRERPIGRRYELQSDSNSFDFFKGLVKRKT